MSGVGCSGSGMMYVSDLCPACGVDGLVLDDQEGRVPYHLDGRVRRVWEVLTVTPGTSAGAPRSDSHSRTRNRIQLK